jgi:hypothetical protein
MKKLLMILLLPILVISLSACREQEDLESLGLANLTAKDILTQLGDGTLEPNGYAVSVYDHELLILVDNGQTISLAMPEDEFYLSVAPYKTLTHECTFHSATGCRGELKSETFFVEFIDTEGNVIIAQTMDTLSNGFIDLWLPRDIEGNLTITQGDYVASKVISTETGQPTCETTMRLEDPELTNAG